MKGFTEPKTEKYMYALLPARDRGAVRFDLQRREQDPVLGGLPPGRPAGPRGRAVHHRQRPVVRARGATGLEGRRDARHPEIQPPDLSLSQALHHCDPAARRVRRLRETAVISDECQVASDWQTTCASAATGGGGPGSLYQGLY